MPKDTGPKAAEAVEVESNHNTTAPAKPVPTMQLVGKPDYNPMRQVGNKANNASDVTLVPETHAELIDEKGDRPTAAEVVTEGGKDQLGRDMEGTKDKPSDPVEAIADEEAKAS